MAPLPRIVVAGTGFPAVRTEIAAALPGVAVEAVAPAVLRSLDREAEVLIPTMTVIDGAIMDRVRGLRLVQQFGAGLEGVDVAAASARGIAVANVPTAGTGNAESVAEWCVMAALASSRRLPELERGIRGAGPWGAPMGRALLGRTAGLVGLGGIGQALARRLAPFGMRLAAVKRDPDPALATRLGLAWLGGPGDLPRLLRESDYLFLCVPLSETTRGLLDRTALALLPEGACIVNPGRGAVLDEDALLEALQGGRRLSAALDVFRREPLDPASPLLGRPEILATPHVAGVTDVSYRGIARRVVENALCIAEGKEPASCVNWAAVARARR